MPLCARWLGVELRISEQQHAHLFAVHPLLQNPTATYEHTWMRVRTMSEKGLSTRVKVIERSLGQHCIVKLRMFAEVLILSGMDDLAAEATCVGRRSTFPVAQLLTTLVGLMVLCCGTLGNTTTASL